MSIHLQIIKIPKKKLCNSTNRCYENKIAFDKSNDHIYKIIIQ